MRTNEHKTLYVTKWALSEGIVKKRCEMWSNDGGTLYAVYLSGTLLTPKEYHLTIESANACVREMIAAKRKSIAKALVKLDQQEKALAAGTFKMVDNS